MDFSPTNGVYIGRSPQTRTRESRMSKVSKKEWEKLKAIALDHPFFDVYPLPLSEEEAKAIVARNNTMTGKEFVDSIYAKFGISRPDRKTD